MLRGTLRKAFVEMAKREKPKKVLPKACNIGNFDAFDVWLSIV